MRFSAYITTSLAILLLASAAHAAPPVEERADSLDHLIAERGFVSHLNHVRQTVVARTSDLVITAMGSLGVPYRFGGNTRETGFDCSGFVRAMYDSTLGLMLPRRAEEQAAATQPVARSDLKPGDLVFFNTMRRAFSHVGIYVGDGKFIHSPRTGATVRMESMEGSYWARRFNGARRVVTDAVKGSGD